MAFFKSLIIASVAAVAFAAPQGASDKNTEVKVSGQDNSPKCGNGQKIACCNSGEDLIGLNCLSVPIRMSIGLSNSRITTQLTINPQSPSPSSRLAVPTSLLAARPAMLR